MTTSALGRMLAGELAPSPLRTLVDAAARSGRVGPGEVDVLEDAVKRTGVARRAERNECRPVDDHQLAGLELADELRLDEVEGTGLRAKTSLPELAQGQRAEAVGSRTA